MIISCCSLTIPLHAGFEMLGDKIAKQIAAAADNVAADAIPKALTAELERSKRIMDMYRDIENTNKQLKNPEYVICIARTPKYVSDDRKASVIRHYHYIPRLKRI